MLVDRGAIAAADVAQALAVQREVGGLIGQILVRLGAVSEDRLLATLSEQLGLPVLALEDLPDPEALADGARRSGLAASWWARREAGLWLLPDGTLVCAARQPIDPALTESLAGLGPVRLALASSQAVAQLARMLGAASTLDSATGDAAADGDPARLRELAEEAPVIEFVNAMFAEAIRRRASDVHIEPYEDRFAVRLRADGVLSEWRSGARAEFDAVASRIKLLSGMDIGERRLPQDGRQSIRVAGQEVDLRVSTLPSAWGESIVLRLLGKTRRLPTLADLGAQPAHEAAMGRLLRHANGVVLITGPTGSGKTTTIYRLIRDLDDGERKIITIEDPVEFDLPGVVQVPVRSDIGLTFASSLRSVLRQDPDVIMVGEIRDGETARIAVQAALTGHLVISTVHTNSALSGAARMLDLGVEEFLLSDVLRGLAAQRLVRRLCDHCAEPEPDDIAHDLETRLRALAPELVEPGPGRWRRAVGCVQCGGTGYLGRMALLEIAEVDADLALAVRRRASEPELLALAQHAGYRTMMADGLAKARQGLTSWAEVLRVLGS